MLVLNKMDRLATELKLDPKDATLHLRRLLENINSCVSQISSGILLEDDTWAENIDEAEARLHFQPEKVRFEVTKTF